MEADHFHYAATGCYVLGAVLAFASLRWEGVRRTGFQLLAVGLGVALHTVGIGFYCANIDAHFFTSWYEIFLLFSWSLGAGYLAVLAAWSMRSLGTIMMPLAALCLVAALLSSRTGPALDADSTGDPLFVIHILSAFLGYGLYITACAASVIYLKQGQLLKRKLFDRALKGLPSLEKLEKAETLGLWAGLLAFTIAVGTGARMANRVGLEQWYLEPKILAAWATWLVFLLLAIGRATGRLAGRTTAKVILAGAAVVILTFMIAHPFGRSSSPSDSDKSEQASGVSSRLPPRDGPRADSTRCPEVTRAFTVRRHDRVR